VDRSDLRGKKVAWRKEVKVEVFSVEADAHITVGKITERK